MLVTLTLLGLEALFFQLNAGAYETVIFTCLTSICLYYFYAYCISDRIEHLIQVGQHHLSLYDAYGNKEDKKWEKRMWQQYLDDRNGWHGSHIFGARFIVVLLDIVLPFAIQFFIFLCVHGVMMLFGLEVTDENIFRTGTIIYLLARIPLKKFTNKLLGKVVA